MRRLALMTAIAVVCAPSARADNGPLDWPLRPRPWVIRVFDPYRRTGTADVADVDPSALLASTRLKPLGG
jgi:hypothetical protein